MGYSFETRVRYSEVARDGRLRLNALIDLFQNCSTFHSEERGVGVRYLKQARQAWLVNSWQIVTDRLPETGEHITVGTIPYEIKGTFGIRNFYLKDGSGDMIVKANSVWFMYDFENDRIMRVDDRQKEAFPPEEKLEMDYAPRKIRLPEGEYETGESIRIRRHHLDTNGHVNNGQYVTIAMDCLEDMPDLRQLRVEYRNASRLGDVMIPQIYRDDEIDTVSLVNEEGVPYAIVEFTKGR